LLRLLLFQSQANLNNPNILRLGINHLSKGINRLSKDINHLSKDINNLPMDSLNRRMAINNNLMVSLWEDMVGTEDMEEA